MGNDKQPFLPFMLEDLLDQSIKKKFDNQLIVYVINQTNTANICCLQVLKCEDLLPFSLSYQF